MKIMNFSILVNSFIICNGFCFQINTTSTPEYSMLENRRNVKFTTLVVNETSDLTSDTFYERFKKATKKQ